MNVQGSQVDDQSELPGWLGNYKNVGVNSLTLLIWRDWDYDPLLCQIGIVLGKARSFDGVASM